jgi:aminoglycoside phosphotransferase (APT) family kinase protein
MLALIQWLREHVPAEDRHIGSRTGIVHGDFRLDNLVFHPTEVSSAISHEVYFLRACILA